MKTNLTTNAGLTIGIDSGEHQLFITDSTTNMTLSVNTKNSFVLSEIVAAECEGAFGELFAAHRIFGTETIFQGNGGAIKVAINGHTFIDEGYDATTIELSDDSPFSLVSLSTTNGFTLDSLYEFHDDIVEFIKGYGDIQL